MAGELLPDARSMQGILDERAGLEPAKHTKIEYARSRITIDAVLDTARQLDYECRDRTL